MRVLFVFGTRPEAIKLAPVIRELAARPEFVCRICVTGQHREMLAQFLGLFELQPDWNLEVMRPDQDLAYLTAAVLSGVSGVLDRWRPERVIVQGDTTSTFAAALAAFYHKIPVAHVEAGLRTGDIAAPWPEEANRLLVARIADLHFAPTPRARDNLLREGVDQARIAVTGNTGIDALLWVSDRARDPTRTARTGRLNAGRALRGPAAHPDDRPSPRELWRRSRTDRRRDRADRSSAGRGNRLPGTSQPEGAARDRAVAAAGEHSADRAGRLP